MAWLRNPVVIGLALLATVAGAFQVAGVVSMLLANIILAGGVWIFIVVEVWCSRWIKKLGRFSMCAVLCASGISGTASVLLSRLISDLRQQQQAQQPSPQPSIVVDPAHLVFDESLHHENFGVNIRNKTDSDEYSVQIAMTLSQASSSDFSFDIPSPRPIILGGRANPANEGQVKTGQRRMHSGH